MDLPIYLLLLGGLDRHCTSVEINGSEEDLSDMDSTTR